MISYVYPAVILIIASLTSPGDTFSTSSKICNLIEDVGSSKLEIKCYNYKNLLRFNANLTEDIRTIKLIRNNINALDSSSFPFRSEAVERLFLDSNNITELLPGVLKNFPNLKILDLTDNRISQFHADVFLENKQLREIYLDENSFEILNLEPFRNLVNLTKVTLEKNRLESCKEETLETLEYFRKKSIDTDVPNLCIQIDAALTEETHLNVNTTSDSGNNLTFGTLYLDKVHFYMFEAFVIVSLSAAGLLSLICIIRRHGRKNNRTRTYSGDYLIVEEESGYLTPRTPSICASYIEIISESDSNSINSGHFENNVTRGAQSNWKLQPKVHKNNKTNHIYEKLKFPHENPYEKI